ncbi:hypothetical protein [Kibdelosporangium aridum]|nr:hypothetical protein [Kibdelosporangium aridum]
MARRALVPDEGAVEQFITAGMDRNEIYGVASTEDAGVHVEGSPAPQLHAKPGRRRPGKLSSTVGYEPRGSLTPQVTATRQALEKFQADAVSGGLCWD